MCLRGVECVRGVIDIKSEDEDGESASSIDPTIVCSPENVTDFDSKRKEKN